ncbi:MAG: hypothetical protein O8C66_07400 [Candidatus Methanoperedens sp.]|nr:hypothetical protein [Candidatus Methanoperedens sp.]MCZ7370320.1 hypothetical protein [Candidatus Methanoperedens sp.]
MWFFNNKPLGIAIFSMTLAILFFSIIPASATTVISLDNTVDTPDRTVTYQDKNYELQDVGAYLIGEPVNISVNVTDINSFQLSLLDMKEDFLWNNMVYYTGGKAEMIMPAYVVTIPGTYIYAVFYQGDMVAFKPVVFSQNKITISPDRTTVAPGGSLHIKVKVIPDTSMPVKVVLAKDSSSLEYPVNRTHEGSYETEIKLPMSAYGRFSLYGAIVSENKVMGTDEFMGISNAGTINITDIPQSGLPSKSGDYSLLTILFVFLAGLLLLVFRKGKS